MHHSNTHHCLPLLAAGVTLVLLAGGCDGLADSHTDAPALASLRGTLSLESGKKAPSGDGLKLASISEVPLAPQPEPEGPENPCAAKPETLVPDSTAVSGTRDPAENVRFFIEKPFAEQTVSLQSDFPIDFTFDIAEPPPDAALDPIANEAVSHALGELVVYRDVNENGRLDPSTFERASPDRMMASSVGTGPWGPDVRLEIEYFTGKYADCRAGYNLVPPGGCAAGDHPVSIRTPIALTLQDGPYLRSKLCTQYCQRPLADYVCPADPAKLPQVTLRPNSVRHESDAYSDWHDDDGTIIGGDRCYSRSSGHHFYEYTTFEFNDCIYEVVHCIYRQDKIPEGVSLPCETYPLDVGGVQPGEDDAG